MHRRGRDLRSRTNYILVTDCRQLQNVVVWDARHNTYHYLVLGFFRGPSPSAHLQYFRKCKCLPIKLLTTPDGVDRLFYELWGGMTNPHRLERLHQAWIFPETCRLIDTRIVALRNRYHQDSRALSCTIRASIQEERLRRAAEAGSTVEFLLTSYPPLI